MLNTMIVRVAIPVAAGALLLTGCGGGGDGGTKIAFQGPLSGDNAALGQHIENGIELAIKEANESGDYDFELEYLAADDGGQEGQSTAAAQTVIDDTGALAVVGPAFSGPAAVAAPMYGDAGMAVVSTSATDPGLTQQNLPTFLQAVPDDAAQGEAMAEFLAGRDDVSSVLVVDDGTAYGRGLAGAAEDGLAESDVSVERESVPANTVDYASAADTVMSANVDAVVYAGYYADLAPFATELDEAGFDGIGLSGDAGRDPELIELAGDAAEGWYLTCACTDASQNDATQAFTERYQEEYGMAPGTYAAESYDATNMIIEAIAELGGDPSREELYDALASMEYQGLTKQFAFEDSGSFSHDVIYLYQVENGEIGYLGETGEATGG